MNLGREIEAFLIDRRARGLASGRLRFYEQKLSPLREHLLSEGDVPIQGITTAGLGPTTAPTAVTYSMWFTEDLQRRGLSNANTIVYNGRVGPGHGMPDRLRRSFLGRVSLAQP